MARRLGALLACHLDSCLPSRDCVVVPVPLSPARHARRGHNQSALIAKEVSRRPRLPYLDALTRVRPTPKQRLLNANERRRSIRGAFRLATPTGPLKERHILLVDDVLTTGATASEASRVLLRANAHIQAVAVVARDL